VQRREWLLEHGWRQGNSAMMSRKGSFGFAALTPFW
jgi:hypothetical protein